MTVETTLINATQLQINQVWKGNLETGMDYLSRILSKASKKMVDRDTYVDKLDFEDEVTIPTSGVTTANAAFGTRLDGTVYRGAGAGQGTVRFPQSAPYSFPGFKSRLPSVVRADLNVALPRWDALKLGKNVSELAKMLGPEITDAANRKRMNLSLKSLFKVVTENPLVTQAAAANVSPRQVPFPVAQNYLAPLKQIGTGATYDASLTPADMLSFLNKMGNACNVAVGGNIGMDTKRMTFDKIDKILVFSNSSWTAFIGDNYQIYGDKDFWGRPIVLEGLGTIRTFMGFLIITIPDRYYLDPVTGDGTTLAPDITQNYAFAGTPVALARAPKDGLHNAAEGGRPASGNFVLTHNMFSCIAIYPQALQFDYAAVFENPPQLYKNPNHALEEGLYSQISLMSRRVYDEGVHRLYFNRRGTPVTVRA